MKNDPQEKTRLWLALGTLVAVFVLGVLAGLGVAHAWRPPPPPDYLARDPDGVLPPFDRFGLTDAQKSQARVIVGKHAAAMEEALHVAFPKMREVRLQLDADMRKILTPEQNKAFDDFLATNPPMPGEPR